MSGFLTFVKALAAALGLWRDHRLRAAGRMEAENQQLKGANDARKRMDKAGSAARDVRTSDSMRNGDF